MGLVNNGDCTDERIYEEGIWKYLDLLPFKFNNHDDSGTDPAAARSR